eukprot:1093459-Rhodomonas_salina.2
MFRGWSSIDDVAAVRAQELPACMKRLTALTLLSLSNNTIRKISDEVLGSSSALHHATHSSCLFTIRSSSAFCRKLTAVPGVVRCRRGLAISCSFSCSRMS